MDRSKLLDFEHGMLIKTFRLCHSCQANESSVAPIGEGGSGVVFLASQELYENVSVHRAIKFFIYRDDIQRLTKHKFSGPVSKEDFLSEITNIASLNHQNLLKVVDAGIFTKNEIEIPYLVSEYIEGPTLREIIDASNPEADALRKQLGRDPTIILQLLICVANGVKHLHKCGFHHCDIAPKNIFIRASDLLTPVLGDLGIAKSKPIDGKNVFIAGTRSFMPDEVAKFYNTEIPWSQYVQLQPNWDLYSFAKTIEEVLSILEEDDRPQWYRPLLSMIQGRRYSTVDDFIDRMEFLLPIQREVANVPELSASVSGKNRKLMPVEALALSRRVERLIRHPALTRLGRVPQLTAAEQVFPGAVHTRYEHSLGVMETVRRYLIALLSQDEFLEHLSVPKIETALVSALLYNITRFPFSNIIHEIKSQEKAAFPDFSRSAIFAELAECTNSRGDSLRSLIEQGFPSINFDNLATILTGKKHDFSDEDQFIYSLLNCSLDARVIDFVRRDSLHLGIVKGDSFDLDELLPHLTVYRHKLALRSTGVTVAEQIISLRYWLFQRVYWCRPNRAFCSMLKEVLLSLSLDRQFTLNLRSRILESGQRSIINFLKQESIRVGDLPSENICDCLLGFDQNLYRISLDVSVAEDATMTTVWNTIAQMPSSARKNLATELDHELHSIVGSDGKNIRLCLIDIPHEPVSNKLGDDIVVIRPDHNPVGLSQFSGIVGGVNTSFKNHLQRLRVMIHPKYFPEGKSERESLKQHISSWLIKRAS